MKKVTMLLMLMVFSFVTFANQTTETKHTNDVVNHVESTVESVKEVLSETSKVVDNTTESVGEVLGNGERVVDKYVEKAYDAIKGLAEALQIPAEFLYGVLKKQQVVNSVTYLLLLIMGLILLIPSVKSFSKVEYDATGDTTNNTGIYLALGMVGCFVSAILIVIGVITIDSIVMGFVNPDYGAIKEIGNFMK